MLTAKVGVGNCAYMKALIFTGGECPSLAKLRELASRAELLIAADSGLTTALSAELFPDFVIGDFDSLDNLEYLRRFPPENVIRYPVEKDFTDTEIAVNFAENKGADSIAIAGGGGGRLDHTLALFELIKRDNQVRAWHTKMEAVYKIDARETLRAVGPLGMVVSVFPLGYNADSMTSEGLKWPLNGLSWTIGQFGISNVSVLDRISIRAGNTPLLAILPPEASVS